MITNQQKEMSSAAIFHRREMRYVEMRKRTETSDRIADECTAQRDRRTARLGQEFNLSLEQTARYLGAFLASSRTG